MVSKVVWVNSGLLGLVVVGLVIQQFRLGRLERRLEEVTAVPTTAPSAQASRAPRGRAAPAPLVVASRARAPAGDDGAASFEDHLWSEDGREAIQDAVAEREAVERDQMRQRFEQMRELRLDRTIGELREELELDDEDAAALRGILSDYFAVRASRWQRMREDDFDPVAFQAEIDDARSTLQTEVETLVGTEGFSVVQQQMRGGRPF